MGQLGDFEIRGVGGLNGASTLEVRHQDELIGFLKHFGGVRWKASQDGIKWGPMHQGSLLACQYLLRLSRAGAR